MSINSFGAARSDGTDGTGPFRLSIRTGLSERTTFISDSLTDQDSKKWASHLSALFCIASVQRKGEEEKWFRDMAAATAHYPVSSRYTNYSSFLASNLAPRS
jgi:hypothetical protein